MWLGQVYAMEFNDLKTALLYFHKALETDSAPTILLSNMAICYINLKNFKEAAHYQKWVLSSMGSQESQGRGVGNLYLYYNQFIALRDQNKIPEAISALKKAIENAPKNAFFYLQLGKFYRETGQEDAAIAPLRKAIELEPSSEEGYDALALLYKKKGEEQKAVAVLVEYLKFKKKHKPLFGEN